MLRPHLLRNGSLALVAASLALAAPAAQAAAPKTVVIHVNGGFNVPTGDFKDANLLDARTGYQFGGGIDYMLSERIAIGVDGSFNKNKHGAEGDTLDLGLGDTYRLDKDRFTTLQAGVHAKWMFPMQNSPIGPYALIGLGAYRTKEAWTETYTLSGTATTSSGEYSYGKRFGGKLGLGAVYKLTEQIGLGLEGDYNFISEDKARTGSSSLQYAGIHADVSFNVMRK
jgi:opacity protein-like surface antigen